MIFCIGVGGMAEQVCDLVVNREKTLGLPGGLEVFHDALRRRVG
jgi:hypothetical protein